MNRTNLVVGAVIVACASSLIFLQRQFDAGDHARAQRLVRNLRAPGRAETFEAFSRTSTE